MKEPGCARKCGARPRETLQDVPPWASARLGSQSSLPGIRRSTEDIERPCAGAHDLEGHSAYRPGRFSLALTGPGLALDPMASASLMEAASPAALQPSSWTGRQTPQDAAGASWRPRAGFGASQPRRPSAGSSSRFHRHRTSHLISRATESAGTPLSRPVPESPTPPQPRGSS